VPGDRISTAREVLDLHAETEIDRMLSGDPRKGVRALGEVFGPRHDNRPTLSEADEISKQPGCGAGLRVESKSDKE
jgi:hypothetical protein